MPHPHRPKPDDMGATPLADPTLGTRDHTPMRHTITVTLPIAGASPFTSDPPITAIGTADPHIFIIGITAGIVIGKVAQSLPANARMNRAR